MNIIYMYIYCISYRIYSVYTDHTSPTMVRISARYTHTDWPKWPPKARRWPPHTWSTRPNARPQRAHRRLRVAARTSSHVAARARIDRARYRRPTRRGSRTRDLRRRRPPRTHARRRSLRLALRGARGAVDAALGACWPCEESPIAPAGRPEQATGSVGDQGGAKIDSSVNHAVAGTLESAGRERAPRDRVAFDAGFESRAAHCQDGIEAELSIAPEKSARK